METNSELKKVLWDGFVSLDRQLREVTSDPAQRKSVAEAGQRSQAWFAARKSLLTGSTLAAFLGECTYSTPQEALLNKLERRFTGNRFCSQGTRWEPVVIEQIKYLVGEIKEAVCGYADEEPQSPDRLTARLNFLVPFAIEQLDAYPLKNYQLEESPSLYDIVARIRKKLYQIDKKVQQDWSVNVPPCPTTDSIISLLYHTAFEERGLLLSEHNYFIGNSPDGVLVDSSGKERVLVEVKSPFFALYKTFPDRYRAQIQLSMHQMHLPFCLFVTSISFKTRFHLIRYDADYCRIAIERLHAIYRTRLLPNLLFQTMGLPLDVENEFHWDAAIPDEVRIVPINTLPPLEKIPFLNSSIPPPIKLSSMETVIAHVQSAAKKRKTK